MSRRIRLIAGAAGAALADLAWLAAAALESAPPTDSRYELVADQAHDVTLERLVECGVRQVWFEDMRTHSPGVWVLEASRRNKQVADCFDRRNIGARYRWSEAPATVMAIP